LKKILERKSLLILASHSIKNLRQRLEEKRQKRRASQRRLLPRKVSDAFYEQCN